MKLYIIIVSFVFTAIIPISAHSFDFRGIELGMTVEEVELILGQKIEISTRDHHLSGVIDKSIFLIFAKYDRKLFKLVYQMTYQGNENYSLALKKAISKYGPPEHTCQEKKAKIALWGVSPDKCKFLDFILRDSKIDKELLELTDYDGKVFTFLLIDGKKFNEIGKKR